MITKILRTIIGLPFVLVAWAAMFLLATIPSLTMWVLTGKIDDDELIVMLTLPYQFIKKVWK